MEGPVEPIRVRKLRAEKQDPKRSADAKRLTIQRRKARDAKRGASTRHGDSGREQS